MLWLADITEHPTAEGKLYMCAIKDACSNRIVGWAIDSRMKARLAVAALEMAVALRQPTALVIVQADRGSQFRSRKFRDELRLAIVWWTFHTYNTRRRQRAVGKMAPVAYELMLTGTPLVEAA